MEARRWRDSGRLRLFDGQTANRDGRTIAADSSGMLSSEMSLLEFYRRFVRGVYFVTRGTSERTAAEYECSLRYWRQLTDDPPLCQIDDETCSRFVRQLVCFPGRRTTRLSPNTVRKHCVAIQHCLDLAGPRTRKHPAARQLIDRPCYLERPASIIHTPTSYSLHDIPRMLDACDVATMPKVDGQSAADWWRDAIMFLVQTGIRRGTLLALEWRHVEDDRLVLPAGYISPAGHRLIKGRRGRVVQLTGQAREILACRPRYMMSIFPWPNCDRSINRQMHDICRAARVKCFGLHGLRKLSATLWAGINQSAAQKQIGHQAARTLDDHYVGLEITALAAKKFPRIEWRPDRQTRMF